MALWDRLTGLATALGKSATTDHYSIGGEMPGYYVEFSNYDEVNIGAAMRVSVRIIGGLVEWPDAMKNCVDLFDDARPVFSRMLVETEVGSPELLEVNDGLALNILVRGDLIS